jgi:alpha-methylacyl-CoA racemase
MAGHDINYLAASGVLSMLGQKGSPPLGPGNILADFAGGGHAAFTGVLLALLHRGVSGKGQIVNANMVDGVSFLGTYPRFLVKMPMWNGERGTNTLDGGAPYYGCYECKDEGKYMSVGALEPQFWAELLKGLGFTEEETTPGKLDRLDKRSWPYMKELFAKRFRTKTRKEWEDIFDGTDACCVPVLEHGEMEAQGYEQRPIVGLSASPGKKIDSPWSASPMKPGQGGEETLKQWVGWRKGADYDVSAKGTFEKKSKSRL